MMREIHLVEVNYYEDTWPGHQEASGKQHEIFCEHLKAKKVIFHTILLGVGGSTGERDSTYTSHTINLSLKRAGS